MLKYKLIKTANAKGSFYCPCTINERTFDLHDIAREIQNNSSFKRSDVLGLLCELKETLFRHLRDGDVVNLNDFGRFKLHVTGNSVADPRQFRPSRDLTGVRCCFSPTAHGTDRQKDLYKDLEFVRVKGGGEVLSRHFL
jgi:predicted histone-like DNA-binding protein